VRAHGLPGPGARQTVTERNGPPPTTSLSTGPYELPFGANKSWAKSGTAGALAGGWQLKWALTRVAGNPLTLSGGGCQVNAPGNMQTPDQIGAVTILDGIGPTRIKGKGATCGATDMSYHYWDPTTFRAVPGTEIRHRSSLGLVTRICLIGCSLALIKRGRPLFGAGSCPIRRGDW